MGQPAAAAGPTLGPGLSSFVGRHQALTEVRRHLATSRLVTLTGPGGVGKTRLAIEAARGVRRQFSDGVFLVELEQVTDPDMVASAVVLAIGLREQPGRDASEVLVDYLGSRHLLLILDNSEHLVDAIARLAETLLQSCHDLRILATSREWLGVPGEDVMPVPTLSLPDDDAGDPADLLHFAAVELFHDRAVAVWPDWELTGDNRVEVTEICRRLDGLPLAIELAAARLRALSERQLLDRLSGHLQDLGDPRRAHKPSRQVTLRSCIEWSHGLCTPEEQLLWARLSSFSGGFELDLAEEVGAGDGLPAGGVLEALTSLIDKSVVIGESQEGVVRFRMLETIREFGREQLAATGEVAGVRRRHRDAYLRLVERADAEWISPRQSAWFARLDREHANIQVAMDYSLTEPGEVDAALRMLAALYHYYWWGRGWAREGRLWLSRALDQDGPPSLVRGRALLTDGSLALADGEFDLGARRLADARAIPEVSSDPASLAFACWVEGSVGLYSGDLSAATAACERGLDALGPDGSPTMRLDILLSYSSALALLGDFERAAWCHGENLRITEPIGECFHRSYALWTLGLSVMQQGDLDRAATLIQQSIDLRRGIRDLTGLGWSEESLAWVTGAAGEHERAATLLGVADRLWEIMGRPLQTYQHFYPVHEGCVAAAREALGDARFDACFDRGRSLDVEEGIAYALRESPAPAPTAPRDDEGTVLTDREQEIADLIAEGLSNRDIATRLSISVRTAEAHTQKILTKLEFRSRTQIAVWAAGRRPPAP